MRSSFRCALYFFIAVISVFLITLKTVSADGSASDSFTVVAVVEPVRNIYVNSNLKITKIVSNTTEMINPEVFTASKPFRQLSFTKSEQSQYLYILNNCLSKKYGVIYQGNCSKTIKKTTPFTSSFTTVSIIFRLTSIL